MESSPVDDMEHDMAFDSAPMPRLSAFARFPFLLFHDRGCAQPVTEVCCALFQYLSMEAGGRAEVARKIGRREKRISDRIGGAGLEGARVGMNQVAALSPQRVQHTLTTSRLQSMHKRMAPRRNGSVIEVRVHSRQPLILLKMGASDNAITTR